MSQYIDKRHRKAPLFDSEFVVTPFKNCYTTPKGDVNGDSPALGENGPVCTADPTCFYCGRVGPGVETEFFAHAIPRSLWRSIDRKEHGSKFANADSLIFYSDLKTKEGRAHTDKLAVPLYRCTEQVRASRVKVHGKEEGTIVEMIVNHDDLGWYCPCDDMLPDGECAYEADEDGIHDGNGGHKIDLEDDGYVVFEDVRGDSDERYMHWQCATSACDVCGRLCPKNVDDDSDDWQVVALKTDICTDVRFCSECVLVEECHGSIDKEADATCGDPSEYTFTRLPGNGPTPRLCSLYCDQHMPGANKLERKHPTSKPPAKRPAKTPAADSESDN